MSDTENEEDLDPTTEERVLVEDEMEDELDAAGETPVEEKPAKKRGNAVAWVALLLALIAVAGTGFSVSRDWLAARDNSTDNTLASLDSRLLAALEKISALDQRITEVGSQDSESATEIAALRRELDESVRGLSSLPARLSTLEGSVSSLAGVSAGTRDTWLLAEAEYYMQIANAQLQLANNPQLAALALGMADERVVQLSDPALIDVRRTLSDELAALDAMEKPDIAGATLTLASLARVVESLPLASSAATTDEPQQQGGESTSGVDRAWSSVKNAMTGLVKVTPPDQAKLALISPDAEYFLRNNIALQLQSARLALLRGEQAVFEQTLDDTSDLLSRYFNAESAQVISAQQTLTEIRSNVFTASVPDISASLRLLRQFRQLRENSQ